MGLVVNSHTHYLPEKKSEAERIAVLRLKAVASILEASAFFDEVGQHYWANALPDATEACKNAFAALKIAKGGFNASSFAALALEEAHKQSQKRNKAVELGLSNGEYDPAGFLAMALISERRIGALIDHLLGTEVACVRAIQDGDMNTVYTSVSSAARQLLETTVAYTQQLVHNSRVTHEASDLVELVWAQEKANQEVVEQAELAALD